jgi:hypothetical protein
MMITRLNTVMKLESDIQNIIIDHAFTGLRGSYPTIAVYKKKHNEIFGFAGHDKGNGDLTVDGNAGLPEPAPKPTIAYREANLVELPEFHVQYIALHGSPLAALQEGDAFGKVRQERIAGAGLDEDVQKLTGRVNFITYSCAILFVILFIVSIIIISRDSNAEIKLQYTRKIPKPKYVKV